MHGTGAQKHVYLARQKDTGKEVAWIERDLPDGSQELAAAQREVRLMCTLVHPHILRCQHWTCVPGRLIMITEFVRGGNMSQHRAAHVLHWRDVRRWTAQLLQALHCMHAQQPPIVHGDVKPDNCLIKEDTADLMLTDLGTAVPLNLAPGAEQTKIAGTLAYMAPEAFSNRYDSAVDVYSVGLTVLQCLTGRMPYGELREGQLYKAKHDGDLPADLGLIVHEEARDFIAQCIAREPGNPEFQPMRTAAALMHPFLAGAARDNDEAVPGPLSPLSPQPGHASGGEGLLSDVQCTVSATSVPSTNSGSPLPSALAGDSTTDIPLADDEGEVRRDWTSSSDDEDREDDSNQPTREVSTQVPGARVDLPLAAAPVPTVTDTGAPDLAPSFPTSMLDEPGQTALDDADDMPSHTALDSALGHHADDESLTSSIVSPDTHPVRASGALSSMPSLGSQHTSLAGSAALQLGAELEGEQIGSGVGHSRSSASLPTLGSLPSAARMHVQHGRLRSQHSSVAQLVPFLRRSKSYSHIGPIAGTPDTEISRSSVGLGLRRQASTTLRDVERGDTDDTATPWTARSAVRTVPGSEASSTAVDAGELNQPGLLHAGGDVVLEITYYVDDPDDPCTATVNLAIEPHTSAADVTAVLLARFPRECDAYAGVQAAAAMLTAFFACWAFAPAVSISAGPFPEWKWHVVRVGPAAPPEPEDAPAAGAEPDALIGEDAQAAAGPARVPAVMGATGRARLGTDPSAGTDMLPMLGSALAEQRQPAPETLSTVRESSRQTVTTSTSLSKTDARASSAQASSGDAYAVQRTPPLPASPELAPSAAPPTAAHTPGTLGGGSAVVTPAVTGRSSASLRAELSPAFTGLGSSPATVESSPARATGLTARRSLPSLAPVSPDSESSMRAMPATTRSTSLRPELLSPQRPSSTKAMLGSQVRHRSHNFEDPATRKELDAKAGEWVEDLRLAKMSSGTGSGVAGSSSGAASSLLADTSQSASGGTLSSQTGQSLASTAAAVAATGVVPGIASSSGLVRDAQASASALIAVQAATISASSEVDLTLAASAGHGAPDSIAVKLSALKDTVDRMAKPGNVSAGSQQDGFNPFNIMQHEPLAQPAPTAGAPSGDSTTASTSQPSAGGAGLRSLGFG